MLPEKHPPVSAQRTGLLLVNLGTPDAPTAPAIRRYLRQFLSDKRVVDLFRPLWWLILNLFILTFRPRRLAHSYASVWQPEGSPLLVGSQRLAKALGEKLGQPVELAMCYGNPSLDHALTRLEQQGVRKLRVLPLYPQYSATTSAASFDGLFKVLMQKRWMPEIHTLSAYHDHPAYIAALAASVQQHWQSHGRGEHLLMSFHGIPKRYFLAGDPYPCHCRKTARLLAEALGLEKGQYSVAFQSRFGREEWVKPYMDAHLVELAKNGTKRLEVICPGFAVDCLETLEEVAETYRNDFLKSGGEAFHYIPALNDQAVHVEALISVLA
jgi:ferrochelatase